MSPFAIRCAAAFAEMLIRTHFVALPVRWQRTTFPEAGSAAEATVVVAAPVVEPVVATAAPFLPLPLPLPGGGLATANDAARPATKRTRNSAFSFMRLDPSGRNGRETVSNRSSAGAGRGVRATPPPHRLVPLGGTAPLAPGGRG